jgi:putative ABC transport system permease protein
MILLVGGGLLLKSFAAMQRADLGFDPHGVVTGFVQIPPARFSSPAEAIAFKDRVLERVSQIPGVSRAEWTSILPLAPGGDNDMDFAIEGVAPPPPDQPGTVAWFRIVSADYLKVMGVRVASGRLFEGREPMPTVVISQTLASRYWPGADPVGRRIRFGGPDSGAPWFTIAGVVADVSQQGARSSARGQVFIPYWHAGPLAAGGMNLVLETGLGADAVRQALTEAMREIDPRLPVTNVSPMTGLIARTVEEPRFLAVIATVFGLLSVVLAAVGVYGVIAYAVTARQQELGVRLALGATRGDVFRLVFADGSRLLLAGIGIGMAGAAVIAPALQTLLFGVEPLDAATFAAMCAVVLATAALAILMPALRAARLSPAVTLRD